MNYNDKSATTEEEINTEAVTDDNQDATYSGQETESEQQVVLDEDNEAGFANDVSENDEASAVTAQLQELQKQADENHQRYLRTQADFDNFRRRAKLEREEFAKYASLQLIEQLLPVVDNLERALAAGKDNKGTDALSKGVEMTLRQMVQILEQQGLKPMETVGQPFNPDIHQAVMQVDSEQFEEGIVVDEIQKGYMLKDKVLRPAMVKVSK